MEKLEKAFELIKKGKKPEKITEALGLSREDLELLQISEEIKNLKGLPVKASERNEMFERIRNTLPSYSASRLRSRLVFGFASLLFLASTVIGLAAYHSNPESPLYEFKNAVNKLVSQISGSREQEEKMLERQIREYRDALEKAEKENRLESVKRLRKKLDEKEALMKRKRQRETERKETREEERRINMPPKKDERGKSIKYEKKIPEIRGPVNNPQIETETTESSAQTGCPGGKMQGNSAESQVRKDTAGKN